MVLEYSPQPSSKRGCSATSESAVAAGSRTSVAARVRSRGTRSRRDSSESSHSSREEKS